MKQNNAETAFVGGVNYNKKGNLDRLIKLANSHNIRLIISRENDGIHTEVINMNKQSRDFRQTIIQQNMYDRMYRKGMTYDNIADNFEILEDKLRTYLRVK